MVLRERSFDQDTAHAPTFGNGQAMASYISRSVFNSSLRFPRSVFHQYAVFRALGRRGKIKKYRRAVLHGHQKVVFRRQKRTASNATYFTFYVGHPTRQGISLLGVSNRITHDVQPHTSQQLHSVQPLTLIFTTVLYFIFNIVFKNKLLHPADACLCSAAVSHTPRRSDT